MEQSFEVKFNDFTLTALTLLLVCVAAVLLTSLTQLTAKTPWPQVLYLGMFRQPDFAILAVILTPQAIFSPIMNTLYASLIPIGLHVLALAVLWHITADWNIKSRLVYFCLSLVPIFGPVAAQTIMKSLGELKAD